MNRHAKSKPASNTDNPLLNEAKAYRAKKRFSQNFLIDENVLSRIADTLNINDAEPVIEIGPGTGFLTAELLKRNPKLTAVEVERDMLRILNQKFGDNKKFNLIEGDVLKFPFEDISEPSFKIVGNLPYSITSPILFRLAGELYEPDYPLRKKIKQITVMVQKEVAERITARPGTKPYNPLSIALQWWFDTKMEFDVKPNSFYPAPKVTSAVVTLRPKEDTNIITVSDYQLLSKLIKQGFTQKRKLLKNALSTHWVKKNKLSKEELNTLFETANIEATARAEQLSLDDFGRLTHAFHSHIQ